MKCQVKGQPLYQRGHFMRSRSDHGDRPRPDPRTMDAGKTKVLISESMLRIEDRIKDSMEEHCRSIDSSENNSMPLYWFGAAFQPSTQHL